MNAQSIEKNWSELRKKIKSNWSKLGDEDVESARGDLKQLASKVQKVYGIGKDQADYQYEQFRKSVQSLIAMQEGPAVSKAPQLIHPKLEKTG